MISIASCGILNTDTVVLFHVLSFAPFSRGSIGDMQNGAGRASRKTNWCLKSQFFSFSHFCNAHFPGTIFSTYTFLSLKMGVFFPEYVQISVGIQKCVFVYVASIS